MSETYIDSDSDDLNYHAPPDGASDLYCKYTGDDKPTNEGLLSIIKDAQEAIDYWNEIRDKLGSYDKPAKWEIPIATRQLDAVLSTMMRLLKKDPSCEGEKFKRLFIRVFECREEAQTSPYNTERYV